GDIAWRTNSVAGQQKCLPTAIGGDGPDIGSNFLKSGQLILAHQDRVQLLSDAAPVAFDAYHPWKSGIVIDTRIAHLGVSKVQMFGPRHQGPEGSADEAQLG